MQKWTPPTPEQIAAADAKIAKDKEIFETMKANFENAKVELEKTFENNLEKLLTPEEKQVMEEGTTQDQAKIIIAKRKVEVQDKLDAMQNAIDDFEAGLYANQLAIENRKLDMKVATDNPEMDLQAFADWVANDIPPRVQKELAEQAGADRGKFVELLVEKFKSTLAVEGEEETPETPEMVTDISGVAGETGDIDTNDGEDTNTSGDFLAKSGMYK